jgi:hypothetical protein
MIESPPTIERGEELFGLWALSFEDVGRGSEEASSVGERSGCRGRLDGDGGTA